VGHRRLSHALADLFLWARFRVVPRRALGRLPRMAHGPSRPDRGPARRFAMIGHYLKLVWSRRWANGLILTEILISFLVLCAIFAVVVYYAGNWRRPLGFDYHNVWTVELSIPQATMADREAQLRDLGISQRLLT